MFFLGRRSVSARNFESFDRVRVGVRVGVGVGVGVGRNANRTKLGHLSLLAIANEKVMVPPNCQCFPSLFVLVLVLVLDQLTQTRQQSIDRHPRSRAARAASSKNATSQLPSSGEFYLSHPPSGDGGYFVHRLVTVATLSTVWRRWLHSLSTVWRRWLPCPPSGDGGYLPKSICAKD